MIFGDNIMPDENLAAPGKRMLELDILRGFAMLVVVCSHTSSVAIENLRAGRAHFLVSMLQSSFNFSVPVFFLVGALLSAYGVAERKLAVWPYYKKKLIRLLLPYLAWTLLYIAFNLLTERINNTALQSADNWVKWITQGRAYDHLYYLIVISQFHLLFPLLIKLARLVRDKPLWVFIIVFGGHNIVYWLNKLWLYEAWPYFQSSFFWHFSIFFLGLYLGLNYEKVCIWVDKHIKLLAVISVVSGAGFLLFRYLLYVDIPYHSYFYYTVRLVYVTFFPLFLLTLARIWRILQGLAGRALLWIGRYSLGIYLAHPMLNHYLRQWVTSRSVIVLFFICAAAVAAYIVICGFLTMFLEKFRPTAWIVGAKASGKQKIESNK